MNKIAVKVVDNKVNSKMINKIKVQSMIKINHNEINNKMIQMLNLMIKMTNNKIVDKMLKNNNHLVKNVLINNVPPKKFIKNLDLKYKMLNIDSYVNHAIKIIVIIISVNFVNKSIQIPVILKMMINGLDVINVIDG